MTEQCDVVVIGGGHNGLTTACLTAMKGKRVVLVEMRDALGGLAGSVEFQPGFKSAGVWHGTGNISAAVMRSLGLQELIEENTATVHALDESGRIAPIAGPMDSTTFGIAQLARSDGRSYVRYRDFMTHVRPVLSRFLLRRPLNLLQVEKEAPLELLTRALGLRLLGSHDMIELLRVAPMPVSDFLHEYFDTDFIKGALSMDAVLGTFAAPRSPGTTTNLLMHESISGQSIKGGSTALTAALIRRAQDLGVEVRCGNAVSRILVDENAVKGIELDNGTTIEAPLVSASTNPRAVLLDMLPVAALTHTTEHRMLNFRTLGTAAHLLFAVDGDLSFSAATAGQRLSHVRIAPTLDHVEKAFDAIKYDKFSDEPVLDITIPSLVDPTLAPQGKSVVSVLIGYAPYRLHGGWTDEAKSTLMMNVIDTISRFAPEFEQKIIAAKLSTPVDLENDYGLTGGHLHHGEPALDQMLVRPIPECFDHETPVRGLTLCGSGTHPGGSVSCAAGAFATRAISHAEQLMAAAR